MSDLDVVAVQLGRLPRSSIDVVTRCHLGMPVVIAVPPHLDDGTPFPTRFWLTCPLAVRRISRREATGGVRAAEARIDSDPDVAERHTAATMRYAEAREALIEVGSTGPRPSGGVGGTRAGVKCLHAHYADHAAGNDNPTGEWVAPHVEPLDCTNACVVEAEGATIANPAWNEPRR